MKDTHLNQKGLTLLEVLLALTLTMTIGGLIYSVFFQSMTSYEKTHSHVLVRQEATIILSQLTTLHRDEETYALTYTPTTQAILINGKSIGNPAFSYSIVATNNSFSLNSKRVTESTTITIDSSSYLEIELTVIDKNDQNQSFTISTIINKLN
jgi:Tfp pilus assembly protein PilV